MMYWMYTLDAEGDWDLLDILPSGVNKAFSSLLVDLALIQKEWDESTINRQYSGGDLFRLALHVLNTLCHRRELLCCAEALRTDVHEPAMRVQLLQREVAVHPVELSSAGSEMAQLENFVELAQCQLADAHSASVAVERVCDGYSCRLGMGAQRHGVLEGLLHGL